MYTVPVCLQASLLEPLLASSWQDSPCHLCRPFVIPVPDSESESQIGTVLQGHPPVTLDKSISSCKLILGLAPPTQDHLVIR